MANSLTCSSHVPVVKPNADVVVAALKRLEQQIPYLRSRVLEIQEAMNSGDLAFGMLATEGARQALETLIATTKSLRGQVVPADGLGDTVESSGELVIRAQRMVMVEQMRQLDLAIRGLTPREHALASFASWSHYVSAAISFIHDRLERIDDIWFRYRSTEPATAVSGNRVLYRAAICTAQRAIREMGSDVEFGEFLSERVTRMEWPDVHRAFASILAVVTLDIDMEPDCQLLVHPVPLHSTT